MEEEGGEGEEKGRREGQGGREERGGGTKGYREGGEREKGMR